jgi:hypothetical protein
MRLSPARPGFKSRRGNHFFGWGECPVTSIRSSTARGCRCIHDFRGSIVVSIPACHAGDPGSIPGLGDNFFDLQSIRQNHATCTTHVQQTPQNGTANTTTRHINAQEIHNHTPLQKNQQKVLPGLEPGLQGSKPWVLTNYTIEPGSSFPRTRNKQWKAEKDGTKSPKRNKEKRHRRDLNSRGQSPLAFKTNSLTTRTRCRMCASLGKVKTVLVCDFGGRKTKK